MCNQKRAERGKQTCVIRTMLDKSIIGNYHVDIYQDLEVLI
jgi:hypothetical protein